MKLFAILREQAGTGATTLVLPEGATVADLIAALRGRYPALRFDAASTMVAVNLEYVSQDHPLRDDDEVALIPPVSGGAGGMWRCPGGVR
ncbi:MAG: molybdopterin converting factor subunit 1 [Chloroflexi bacterium]|nr:molybdopterin converting factor subunit 1 [Chloroflexota bacterium]